jgi:hypothetical protein
MRESSHPDLTYSARFDQDQEQTVIAACNVTSVAIDDDSTNFNLLVIDAQ